MQKKSAAAEEPVTTQRRDPQLEVLFGVAAACGACLRFCKRAFGTKRAEASFVGTRLADVCSRVGAKVSGLKRDYEEYGEASDWLVVALARFCLGAKVASRRRCLAMVRLNWTVAEGRRAARLLDDLPKEEALLEALRQAEAAAAVLGSKAAHEKDHLWHRTHAEIAQANLALGVARKRRFFAGALTDDRLVVEPLLASLRASEALEGPRSAQAAAAKYQIGAFRAEEEQRGKQSLKRYDEAQTYLQEAKRTFASLGLGAHATLCAVALSDLFDAHRERQKGDTSQKETTFHLALLALAELVETRHVLRNADPDTAADAIRQLKARLPTRAKTLLHHALLQTANPLLAAHCKPVYKAALAMDKSQLPDSLDSIATTLEPFLALSEDTS